MQRFDQKCVVVTGAAKGIGFACAERFASEGGHVFLLDMDFGACNNASKKLNDKGFKTEALSCDVTNDDEIHAIFEAIIQQSGHIDVLINNAGIIHTDDFLDISMENFDRVMAVNLRAPMMIGQLVARHMAEKGIKGSIINMSSINSVLAIPNQVPYVTSKGGLKQLTKVMALSLADKGIRVNAIGPGSIMTELLQGIMTDEAARQKILSRTPMGRCGDPSEVASVAAFLASDEASYMTGQTIFPDGGRLALNYTVPVK